MTDRAVLGVRASATFWTVWVGQFVSIVGSGLTLFGIPIWLFVETGSITQLATLMLVMAIARTVASPLVGTLVDRWDRRRTMMLSDAGAAMGTLAIAALLAFDALEVWHLYPALAVSAFFSAFQFPAYHAAITLLVPKDQLGKAAGLAELAESAQRVGAPVIAGALLTWVDLWAVVLADVATFLVALATLAVVRFPSPPRSAEAEAAKGTIWGEAKFGFQYLRARRGLWALVLFIAAIVLLMSFVNVLLFPLVLEFASEAQFGLTLSLAAIALLVGSAVMSAWGGPQRKVYGTLGFMVLLAIGTVVAGLSPSLFVVAAGMTLVFFPVPIVNGCSHAIFQTKVAPDVQGRVFAIRRMFGEGMGPIAFLLAGPIAEWVFEPWMAEGGALAGTVGEVLGTGPGRGVGLIFVLLGLATFGVIAAGFSYGPLRNIDTELPDAIPDEPVPAAQQPARGDGD